MPYLIDTDWTIDRLAQVPEAITLLDRLAADGISLSIITYMEVYQGILRSTERAKAEREFDEMFAGVPLLPLSKEVARRCSLLREALKQQGKRVNQRALDLIIAATAIEYDARHPQRQRLRRHPRPQALQNVILRARVPLPLREWVADRRVAAGDMPGEGS